MNAKLKEEQDRLCILLAEDHATAANVLAAVLSEYGGYKVDVVGSADQALVRLREGNPELAMIDIDLHSRSGLRLARELHRRQPALPVLIVSPDANRAHIEQALAAGARGYVLKDDASGILQTVREALEASEEKS